MHSQHEKIYEKIAGEMEAGNIDKGLWTRLFVECEGDEQLTKVAYIKQRAERLITAAEAASEQKAENQVQQESFGKERQGKHETTEAFQPGPANPGLVAAVKDGNFSQASKLLIEGVKPDGLNDLGFSLLDIARNNNDKQMYALLKRHGATLITDTDCGWSKSGDMKVKIDSSKTLSVDKTFLNKLEDGDYGLAKTYWLFGVLVGFVFNVIAGLIEPNELFLLFFLAYAYYAVFLLKGIWIAANKYKGPTVWAILAKIAVVLGIISFVIGFIALVSVIGG